MKTVGLLHYREYGAITPLSMGIVEYARTHGRWLLRGFQFASPHSRRPTLPPLDGLIAYPFESHWAQVQRMRIPKVVIVPNIPQEKWTAGCVGFDEPAIGALAAEHLLDRGYRRFMYVGPDNPWSVARGEGFSRALRKAGFDTQFAGGNDPRGWPSWLTLETPAAVDRIVKTVPARCGVMVCNDLFAQTLIAACERVKRVVPDDIAVVGVDNDLLYCEFGTIPSSSIDPNVTQMGLEAAALLEDLMNGKAIPKSPVVVKPRGVVVRRSSDSYATEDQDVLSGLELVRKSPRLTVDELASTLAMSRATLERRFRAQLGRSPAEELRRRRLEIARQMLVHTRRPLSDIALDCGFDYLSTFSKLFRRVHGITPSEYRRQAEGGQRL